MSVLLQTPPLGETDRAARPIERLLRAHEPYPAMVVDGRYRVVDANAAALARFGPALVGSNLIRRYTDEAARAAIANGRTWHAPGSHASAKGTPDFRRRRLGALVAIAEAAVADCLRARRRKTS